MGDFCLFLHWDYLNCMAEASLVGQHQEHKTRTHTAPVTPDTDTSAPDLSCTVVSSGVGSSHCEIASSSGAYSITPGSSPQQNEQSTQGEN